MKKHLLAATALMAFGLTSVSEAALNKGKNIDICAPAKVAQKVQKIYKKMPGAPLAIIGRVAGVPEVHVATGLPKENSVGILANPEIVKKVWATIDDWGKSTHVRLVFTMGGGHVLDFPHMIPITQTDLDDGWIDIYADDGNGVHGHMWLERIHSIQAVDIPGRDDVRTRTISFYGPDGKLVMGVYASITTKKFDQNAVDGFAKTRALIASLPQACK